MVDVPDLVEQYDETHLLTMEGNRRANARRVRKEIANSQSLCASRTRCAPSNTDGREEGLSRGANRVVNTTLTVLSPREARCTCLSRQPVQFVLITSHRFLFKPFASCIKFVESGFMTNVIDIGDKQVPRLHQRELVSLSVAVVPSMSEKDIDVKSCSVR